MADAADIAADLIGERVTANLARIDGAIPAGVAGECEDCGEEMPRLVGGLCGFCRDGRRPPAAAYDRAAKATDRVELRREKVMPATSANASTRKIAVQGRALRAVDLRAAEREITYQQAAAELITLAADGQFAECAASKSLDQLSTEDLLNELAARWRTMAGSTVVAELEARAEAAERKLAAVTVALGGAA